MKLVFAAMARERICQLHPTVRQAIQQSIDQLTEDPYLGKPLQDELLGFRSLACRRYRIIYEIKKSGKEVFIYTVGHREDVYEVFSRHIKRQH